MLVYIYVPHSFCLFGQNLLTRVRIASALFIFVERCSACSLIPKTKNTSHIVTTHLDPGALLHVAFRGRNRPRLEPVCPLLLVFDVVGLDPLALVE